MHSINPELSTLILGYGNPGRQDDGLGPCFIDALVALENNNLRLQANYQLTVEDALEICNFQQVIFVDASFDCDAPFEVEQIFETTDSGFGSHSLTPHAVIQLCQTLYQHTPKAFILAIRGQEFDQFEEKLSHTASNNLNAALAYFMAMFVQQKKSEHKDVLSNA